MTRKLIIYDGRNEREVALVGTLIVGRDPSCHISDLDPLLSRRHAEFVSTSRGVTLRDLGSRNGMLVNGEKVTERRLVEGDVVQLGHLQFRFVEEKTVLSPDDQSRANSTTTQGFDHSTLHTAPPGVAEVATPGDDVPAAAAAGPEPPARGMTHGDGDHTRVAMPPGSDATFIRPALDPDATFAAPAAPADLTPAPAPALSPADEVETFAVRGESAAEALTPQPAPSGEADVPAPARADEWASFDRTFVVPPDARRDLLGDPPAERFPRPSAAAFGAAAIDLEATLGPDDPRLKGLGRSGLPSSAPLVQPARVVAGPDHRVRTASVATGQLLGTPPEQLIGLTLDELFGRCLRVVEGADGPSVVSFTVERSPVDRTWTLTLTAGRAVEPVS